MTTLYLILGKLILINWLLIIGLILKIFYDRKKQLTIIQTITSEIKVVKEEIKRLKKRPINIDDR